MVPKIWNLLDRSFCHFGPFYTFLSPSNLKNKNFEKLKKTPGHIITDIWHITDVIDIFHFGLFFALLPP